MARTKKTAEAAVDPQLQFAALIEKYKNLPAGDENAFKGTEPNGKVSPYQKDLLGKMGITVPESTTRLYAHASIKAFGEMYPEQNKTIMEAHNAEVAAKKAAAKTAGPKDAKSTEAGQSADKGYRVNKENAGKPATYFMMVQLNEAGIRKYNDPSPMPTQGEVAEKMNALRTLDKEKYDKAMTVAGETVAKWKHMEPTPAQTKFAESIGIKVTPFVSAEKAADGKQSGSTAFSVGEKIHNLKVAEPEKYAQAKAASAAAAKAEKEGKPDVTAGLSDLVKAEISAKTASTAAKTGAVPALTIPTATPAVQAEGPQAGG